MLTRKHGRSSCRGSEEQERLSSSWTTSNGIDIISRPCFGSKPAVASRWSTQVYILLYNLHLEAAQGAIQAHHAVPAIKRWFWEEVVVCDDARSVTRTIAPTPTCVGSCRMIPRHPDHHHCAVAVQGRLPLVFPISTNIRNTTATR